jgi:GAF domain-containing protein
LTRRLTAEGWEKYFTGQRDELVVEDVRLELTTAGQELADSHQYPGGTPQPAAASAPALLTLPIMLRGEPIGAIDLELPAADPYWDEENVSIVRSVAERVGLALDNARLFEQTQIALSETEQLYNVGLHINTAASLEDLLQAAIAPSIATGASSAGIWLFELNEAQQPTQMELAVSWTREGAPPLSLGTRLRVADYPSSKLWLNETGQSSFLGDIARDERVDLPMRVMFQRLNIAATAFMPLTLGNRWVGLIIVSWRELHGFSEGEQRMYQSIASQVAVALENRRLFERAERRAERERLVADISSRMFAANDLEAIVQIAGEELSRILRVKQTTIKVRSELAEAASQSGNGQTPDQRA